MLRKLYGYFIATIPLWGVVAIWLSMEPINQRFGNYSLTLLSLGQLTGLLGLVLFSITLTMHSRVRVWQWLKVDAGLVCKMHHNLGLVAFLLMFAHPLFLAVNTALYSVYEAARLLLPKDDIVYLWGFASLWLLAPVILLADSLKKYHSLWLWLHRVSLVSFAFGLLHLWFVTSDTSRNPVLKYYVLFWALVGLVAFIYQRIAYKYKKPAVEGCER